MPSYTGRQIARAALREIGVLDPTQVGIQEQINDALDVATDLLDEWRADKLTIGAATRSAYNLTSGTQNYSIGSGGAFDQDYPTEIAYWSVIPDRTATYPSERPMGRPLTYDEWQLVRIKSQTGAYPNKLYFDRAQDITNARGTCTFHPVPNTTTVQVALYQFIAALTALVAGTTYNLRIGAAKAIKLNLAVELGLGRYAREGGLPAGLERRAARALGSFKRHNFIPQESPMRSEFSIGRGSGRRTFNVYQGSS